MLPIKLIRIALIACLLMAGVLFIFIALIVDKLSNRPASILVLTRIWYRLLLRILNVKVAVEGQYNHQGALVCSNHVSWLDIPVIGSAIPSYFLSKAELRDTPILGWLAHHAGTLFIHRGTGQSNEVKQLMRQYLDRDHCLTFFPEATTGNGYALRKFHPRLFSAAIETETSVLPVALRYHDHDTPDQRIGFGNESMGNNLWRLLGRWRTKVTLTVLTPLTVLETDRKSLAQNAMHSIADALNLPPERRGLDFRAPLPEVPAPPHQQTTL